MRRFLSVLLLILGSALLGAEPIPLVRGHAHNDYLHARPLLDALDRGFCSIEADVHLVDGELRVAHDRKDVKTGRTLTSLYLEPLRERVRRNGGRVYRDGPTITLLIDVKSEAGPTYEAVQAELEKYVEMLTTFDANGVTPGAVVAIVSGNRPPKESLVQRVRYAALDGRKEDLELNPSATLVPLVSENWKKIFTWNWQGEMPDAERAALRQWTERAHAQGRKVRFWNTPDRPDAWKILIEAGVDIIGTDDLEGLQRFLQATRS